ncbi:MAG: hypothetical protein AAB726_01230 [Patescibacteria group bacterium]
MKPFTTTDNGASTALLDRRQANKASRRSTTLYDADKDPFHRRRRAMNVTGN